MDVVGTAASLVTILDVALRVTKAARNLAKDIEGAPVELRNVFNKLELVRSLLQQLLALRPELGDRAKEFLPLDFRMSLATALEQTSHAINKASTVCRYRGGRIGVRTRFRWALVEKTSVDKALVQLKGAESSLMLALQLLELRLALLARTSLNSVLVAQNLVAQELATMKIAILSTQSTTASIIFDVVNGSEESQKADVRRQTPNRILELDEDSDDSSQETIVKSCDQRQSRRSLGGSVEFQSSRWLRNLEISGTISSYWDENQSTYNISLKSKLPRLFGNRALTLEFKIRHYAMCWSSVSLMHSAIAVSHIVSEDSEIMKACRQGNESWARNLFRDRRAGPNDLILGMESWEPNGPLSAAISSGNCNLVRYLVDCGADVNSINNDHHRSPLQTACGGLELDISRFLVSRGASLEHVDVFGQNVAHHVVSGFNWRLNVPKLQCLFVKFLLSNSFFDFDALDCIHRSPLHHAADCSTVDVTQLLLKYGADSHARDINGQTALHRAATVGNSALVWFLLDCGSDVSSQNDEGDTPLHFAACMGELAVCTMLLECGADVSAKDLAGVTPLHGAATFDFSQDLFMVLFEHGADPHKVGCLSYDNGRTLYLFEGMETPADIARRDGPSITASYVKILHDFYPEIIVDEEGDVFWNTQEDGVPGYGCSYDSVELIEIIEARREEAWLNGGRSH